jgi:predicted negative regulator of RcsB-dependent stress response
MARERRPQQLDTEDHVTERIIEAAAWAETHRRAVIAGGIVLVLVVAAAFYYQDYRSKLIDRASVRFQELQISSQSADAATLRSELRIYIDQYASTPYADQARVALAELELGRDNLGLAVQALEPVADKGESNPLGYTAMRMIATAYEEGGDLERANRWYERIRSDARFDYQRQLAMAEQARLHTEAGRYGQAASLYEQLLSEVEEDPGSSRIYAVRLGEVRILQQEGAAPPGSVPMIESAQPEATGSGADSGAGAVPDESSPSVAPDAEATDSATDGGTG